MKHSEFIVYAAPAASSVEEGNVIDFIFIISRVGRGDKKMQGIKKGGILPPKVNFRN